jgi:hypothetical protein
VNLDSPGSRVIAALVAAAALALAGWLVYTDNRTDPAVAACIARHTAAIEAARAGGALPTEAAARFLSRVAPSCAAQAGAFTPR